MISNRRVFLKQVGAGAISFGFMATFPGCQSAEQSLEASADFSLPRSIPEQQGISSAGIRTFLQAVEQSNIEFHSIMIMRHGHVVAEGWWAPYAPQWKHSLYSLSKSFTSTAVGLAIAEGHFTVEDPVISFFPEDVPENISVHLGAMQVKHLLTMSTGHAQDTMSGLRNANGDTWVQAFLGLPVEYEPGTHFLYNTGATYMLSAIVQKVTGQTLMQYLQPRLFEPLGMEGMDWLSSPEGINTGGYGLRVKTEDIAKFGQLYLQKGQWNGQQIIPSAWVEEATRAQVQSRPFVDGRPKADDDWAQGYGYQFWLCTTGGYRGDGAYGQYCLVLPDKDTVIAITSESFDMQASMNLVWDHLLPAMEEDALPANENAQAELKKDLENLSWEPPRMNPHSPIATQISGKTFTLGENDFHAKKIAFNFSENACTFTLTDEKGEHRVTCGMHQWIEEDNEKTDPQALFPARGRTDLPSHMAASATWQDDNTLVMTWRFIETAHSDQLTCIFDGDKVTLQFLNSVAAGSSNNPDSRPELYGIMV